MKLIQNEIIDELLIYDVTGEIQLNKQASTVSFFDVSFLTTGVYFIYIKTNMRTARIGLLKL
nr:T9SS type A sorting domain-containing protein [uncultured Draconibacterium sp.]